MKLPSTIKFIKDIQADIRENYDDEFKEEKKILSEVYFEEIIKALEEQDNHRWIPVSERLPEDDELEFYDMNLVTLDNGDVCLGVYRLDDKVWYTRMQEGEEKYSTNHTVIAWMPLPEPYKKD